MAGIVCAEGHRCRYRREAIEAAFRTTPPALLKTLTYDQGSEMAEHAKLATHMNINVYFAGDHSPGRKGRLRMPMDC